MPGWRMRSPDDGLYAPTPGQRRRQRTALVAGLPSRRSASAGRQARYPPARPSSGNTQACRHCSPAIRRASDGAIELADAGIELPRYGGFRLVFVNGHFSAAVLRFPAARGCVPGPFRRCRRSPGCAYTQSPGHCRRPATNPCSPPSMTRPWRMGFSWISRRARSSNNPCTWSGSAATRRTLSASTSAC